MSRPANQPSETIREQQRRAAAMIDHTLLKPDAVQSAIEHLCEEAVEHGFATVCVNPCWVQLCASHLAHSAVKVCTVVGFPLGANTPEMKLAEARQAVEYGAREIDMVQNVGALRSGLLSAVDREIQNIAEAVHAGRALLKVILETCLLTSEELLWSCRIGARAGADFVKTSTGFGSAGATVEHVRTMRSAVPPSVGVKAAGGIRTWAAFHDIVDAGATRVGTSSGIAILNEIGGAANVGGAGY